MAFSVLLGAILITGVPENEKNATDSHPDFQIRASVSNTQPPEPISDATVIVRDASTNKQLFKGKTDGKGISEAVRLEKSVKRILITVDKPGENASACEFDLPVKDKVVDCSVPIKDEIPRPYTANGSSPICCGPAPSSASVCSAEHYQSAIGGRVAQSPACELTCHSGNKIQCHDTCYCPRRKRCRSR